MCKGAGARWRTSLRAAKEKKGVRGQSSTRLTGGQVVLSLVQLVSVGVAKVDGEVEGAKVPAAHTVQVLSAVAVAAAE